MDNWHKGLGGLLIATLIYIIFLTQCNKCPDIVETEVISIDTTKTDTIIKILYLDTNTFKNIPIDLPDPIYITTKVDTEAILRLFNIDLSVAGTQVEDFDQIFIYPSNYTSVISDDTVQIEYSIDVRGYLDKVTIGYKLLQPFRIERSIYTEVELTKRIKQRYRGLYIGIDIGANKDRFSYFTPELELTGKMYNYSIGFNVIDRSVIVGLKRRLF